MKNKQDIEKDIKLKDMKKVFKTAQVRDLLNQVHNEEITFSRLVEILNECANETAKEYATKACEDLRKRISDDVKSSFKDSYKGSEYYKYILNI